MKIDPHGFALDSLYIWGEQPNDKYVKRRFARKETGFYKTTSSYLKPKKSRYGSSNTCVIDEIYAKFPPITRTVMTQHFIDGREETIEVNSIIVKMHKSTYYDHLQRIILETRKELMQSAVLLEKTG